MEKQVLITGASQGIGRALVKAFLKDPSYRVWAAARNGQSLNTLADECRNENERAPGLLVGDITDEKIRDYIYEHISAAGPLDILINNAGLLVNKPFAEITADDLQRILQVNVTAPFLLSAQMVPLMEHGAHIVNISSMGGVQGSSKFPGLSAYSAAKGALNVLTECMAVELADKNITVNSLALGAVQTDMLEQAFPGYKAPVNAEEAAEWIRQFAVGGRRFFNGKILPVSVNTP